MFGKTKDDATQQLQCLLPARSHHILMLLTMPIHPTHMAPFSVNMRHRYIWARRRLL